MLLAHHTPSTIPMYRAIHHDRKNEIVFVWYADGSKQAYKAVHKFYTPNSGEYGGIDSGMVDIYGKPMYACVVDGQKEYDIREKNSGMYNELSELDVDYRTRFLENHYKEVTELRFSNSDINIGFVDIEVESGDRFPSARRADRRVNCVTLYLSKPKKFITFGLQKYLRNETIKKMEEEGGEYRRYETERELIVDLFKTIGESDIDILSGYNCNGFTGYDFPYLAKRSEILEIDMRPMSRLPQKYRSVYISKKDGGLVVAGTEVIDYLPLYKKFSRSERDNYKLNTIGKEEVGEEKAPLPDGYKSYIHYWDDFVYYNFKDVDLLKKIEAKRRMIESLVGACSEARVPFGHFFEAKKMLVGFILNFLHKRNIVMPPLKEHVKEEFPGAFVYTTTGHYKNLVSYDYRSMYPSIMMGANISPETKVVFETGAIIPDEMLKNLVRSPWTSGGTKQVFYRKDKEGIIPAVVKILFDGRTELKVKMKKAKKIGNTDDEVYYDMKQNAYKILGNSLYGLLGNNHFQFYDLDNAASVTAFGVELITNTISDLSHYVENQFENDNRFVSAFGSKPTLDKTITGLGRFSHGDTDSFFMKYEDFYDDYSKNVGKAVEVVMFKGSDIVERKKFELPNEEKDSKIFFNKLANAHIPSWSTMSPEDKKKNFDNGILTHDDIRIIYSKFCLTDFCRILDAIMMEDTLADIMQKFADKWNFRENTLYLKREKCIQEAIVLKKKKYICNIESNEDIKTDKIKFGVTGVEIVRSSTLQFTRERVEVLVKELLKNKNKEYIQNEYLKTKKEFYDLVHQGNLYAISIPSGVKDDPPVYEDMLTWPEATRKKVDWRLRACSVWNHLIDNEPTLSNQMLEPIYEGAKVKFIKVHKNRYGINTIAYVGDNCPPELLKIFNPDWDAQWETGFKKVMGRLFEAVGWSKDLENDRSELAYEIF